MIFTSEKVMLTVLVPQTQCSGYRLLLASQPNAVHSHHVTIKICICISAVIPVMFCLVHATAAEVAFPYTSKQIGKNTSSATTQVQKYFVVSVHVPI